MPRRLHASALLLGAALAFAGATASEPVRAATLLAVDLAQLVKMSDYVVLAKAESRTSRKQQSSGMIVTDVRLRVQSALKGATKQGESITATLLGGTIGDVGLHVSGEANIPDGRGVIVFLRRAGNGELNVSGMGQGVLSIAGQGGSAMVMPAAPDAALVQADPQGKLQPSEPQALPGPQPLAAVLAEIRRLAGTEL